MGLIIRFDSICAYWYGLPYHTKPVNEKDVLLLGQGRAHGKSLVNKKRAWYVKQLAQDFDS
jgi:hypothetical protein